MTTEYSRNYTAIVADGSFPSHPVSLEYLRNAERIVCCDGSAEKVIGAGLLPAAIVGDLDSLGSDLQEKYPQLIFRDTDQETNDLTKAVEWCRSMGYLNLVLLGATGKREDHTLGNISLLADYASFAEVIMVTDTGIFRPLLSGTEIITVPGQQISIFSVNPATEITSTGLKYTLSRKRLENWWQATLNEATSNVFSLEFHDGKVLVYLKFNE